MGKHKGPTPRRPGGREPEMDPRAMAGVDLIRRTGATGFQIRYSDDEKPVVWIAVAEYKREKTIFQVAAGLSPEMAIGRLLETLIDGGRCTHCGRPSGFDPELVPETMPMDNLVCWYQFDPELATYRRGCEGDG